MQVFSRPFTFSWIPGVKDRRTIFGPSRASATRWELDMLNHIRKLFAGFDFEKA
jgi:hypothetical protein